MGMCHRFCLLLMLFIMVGGCSSTGNLGIVTRPSADNASRLKAGVSFEDFGPVEGSACRHFVIAVIPFGDSTFSKAVEDALGQKGADALINVTVTSSLYGFVPIYNVYSFTCTSVQGVAVKFKPITLPSVTEKSTDPPLSAKQDGM